MSARRAGRDFIGTHYFSPASRMKLVEIIPAFETAPETVETAMRLCREAGKTPIPVKDVAGFAVNRMFLIFLAEAVRLVEDGVATPEDIDTACRLGLGHPMGPFELMDAIGSKLALQASGNPARGLWRTLPPPGPAETAGARRVCRRPRQQGLAQPKLTCAAGRRRTQASGVLTASVCTGGGGGSERGTGIGGGGSVIGGGWDGSGGGSGGVPGGGTGCGP